MAIGCLAAAALAVNNHRDIAHDRLVGRRTFAVTFGARGSQRLYAGLLLLALRPGAGDGHVAQGVPMLLPLLLLPSAWQLYRDFLRCPPGTAFNDVLFRTFRLELWFAALLSAGAVASRLIA